MLTWLPWRQLLLAIWLLAGVVAAGPAAAAAASAPEFAATADALQLDPANGDHDLWPSTAVLDDPQARYTLREVEALASQPGAFDPVGRHQANLGRRHGAVWLRTVLRVPGGPAGHWLLQADYAPLDRIDVYLLDGAGPGARLIQQLAMGDHVPWAEQPRHARVPIAELQLPAAPRRGADTVVLLLRVQTTGSMLVPLSLRTAEHFEDHEASEQALQGLIAGASLLLLVYSLSQWFALRDALFGWYALALVGNTGFFAALSGTGPQHLWSGSDWLTRNAPPFSILLGVAGAFFFVHRALGLARHSPHAARLVQGCGAMAGFTALAFAAGGLSYSVTQAIGMGMGPLPVLLVLPTAWRRTRAGERAAALLLVGWSLYALGALSIVGLLAGWVPLGFWSLHGFQFGATAEMLMWMAVLARRVQAVHDQARVLRGDRDRLHSLAHTDALTGLLNRRGLHEALVTRVALAIPQTFVAIYVLDLDGFKAVNDRLGHDAGDALLVAVGQRLQRQLRTTDLVGRLGGDEFVLAASGFNDAADAARLGDQVLRAFDAPFELPAGSCAVGVTIGYALAPQDGQDLDLLLKQADRALYAGKADGRRQVRRAGEPNAATGLGDSV